MKKNVAAINALVVVAMAEELRGRAESITRRSKLRKGRGVKLEKETEGTGGSKLEKPGSEEGGRERGGEVNKERDASSRI